MSTHAKLYAENSDGTFTGTYRHYDGYPSVGGYDCYVKDKLYGGDFRKYIEEYIAENEEVTYTFNSLEEICKNMIGSFTEYSYVKMLDGTWKVYELVAELTDDPHQRFKSKVKELTGTGKTIKDVIIEDGGHDPDADIQTATDKKNAWNAERNHMLDIVGDYVDDKVPDDDEVFVGRLYNIINEYYDRKVESLS